MLTQINTAHHKTTVQTHLTASNKTIQQLITLNTYLSQQQSREQNQCLPRTKKARDLLDQAYQHLRQGIEEIMKKLNLYTSPKHDHITTQRTHLIHQHHTQTKLPNNKQMQSTYSTLQQHIQNTLTKTQTIAKARNMPPNTHYTTNIWHMQPKPMTNLHTTPNKSHTSTNNLTKPSNRQQPNRSNK